MDMKTIDMNLGKFQETVRDGEAWSAEPQDCKESDTTEQQRLAPSVQRERSPF